MQNHSLYKKLKEDLSDSWDKTSLTNVFACKSEKTIFTHLDRLVKEVSIVSTSR